VRLQSKVWKVRQQAFEDLANAYETAAKGDEIYTQYEKELPKFLSESNAAAQEKALLALKIWLEKTSAPINFDVKEAVKTLIDKALSSAKPTGKKLCNEIICLFFERNEKANLNEAIIACLHHKTPKVQSFSKKSKKYKSSTFIYTFIGCVRSSFNHYRAAHQLWA
jgi:hypothetical protein